MTSLTTLGRLKRNVCAGITRPLSAKTASLAIVAMLACLGVSPEGAIAQVRGPAEPGKASLQIELGGHAAPIRRLAVSKRLGLIATVGDDKTARVWDLNRHELRQVLRPAVGDGDTGKLYGAAFHPSESLLAVAGSTGTRAGGHQILLFAPDTGRLIKRFDARGGDVKDLAYTPDGQLLLATYAGDSALRAFDQNGQMVFEQALPGLSYGVAIAANGRIAAATLAGTIHLFRYANGQIQADGELRGSGRPVSIAFSPDASRLLVGYFEPAAGRPPEVFDLNSRRVAFTLDAARLEAGNLMTVGFSEDGQLMLAGGTGYSREGQHELQVFDAGSGRLLAQHLLASNSIFDLATVGKRKLAFAAFDGSWGELDLGSGAVRSTGAGLADFRGPRRLRINDDGSILAFSFNIGGDVSVFDMKRREIRQGAMPDGLFEPRVKRGFFGGATWENERKPSINGTDIALAADEVGRSIVFFHDNDAALFGSSKGLFAINENGGIRWRVATSAEVLAINIRRDNKLAVTAMSDGTIRWWNVDDGTLALTLLPRPDGRWAMFTPEGQFDASAGADRIVGWVVNREDASVADFFSLNRFRDEFNRPKAIDSLLGLAIAPDLPMPAQFPSPPPGQGVVSLEKLRPGASAPGVSTPPVSPAVTPPVAAPSAKAPVPPSPSVATPEPAAPPPSSATAPTAAAPTASLQSVQFPPVLTAIELTKLLPSQKAVKIPFTIRSKSKPDVEVRVDGRPQPDAQIKLPTSFTGRERAIAELTAPPAGSVIQIIARDENGISEPLGFKVGEASPTEAAPVVNVPPVVVPLTAAPQPVALAAPSLPSSQPAPTSAPVSASNTAGGAPRLFVLSIGISKYERPQYQLGLADKDSRDFVSAVTSQRGQYYADVQARLLNNEQATRAGIVSGLDWLASQVGPDDVGMLFLAGHGVNAPDGQYYFMPFEGQHERLGETSVPERQIRATLGKMRGRALFFVDTCYAGNALGNFRTASRELAKLANNLAASENGVIVFASSSGRQLSEENDAWGNGAFTKALIEGLSGKADLARSGQITYKGLDYYVSDQVSRLTEGRQTPVTISPIGIPDFAIASVRI